MWSVVMITEKLRKTAFRECWSEQTLNHGAQIADGIGGRCLPCAQPCEGEMILLEPKARTKDFPDASVFVPALAHRLLPKRKGFSRLLVNVDHPDGFVIKKTKTTDPAGTENDRAAPRRV